MTIATRRNERVNTEVNAKYFGSSWSVKCKCHCIRFNPTVNLHVATDYRSSTVRVPPITSSLHLLRCTLIRIDTFLSYPLETFLSLFKHHQVRFNTFATRRISYRFTNIGIINRQRVYLEIVLLG